MFFLVEKMESLVAQQSDVRMLSQKIVNRGCAGFLHTGDYEIHALNMAPLKRRRVCGSLATCLDRSHARKSTTFRATRNWIDSVARSAESGFYRQRGRIN
jgi:hypothetical protein